MVVGFKPWSISSRIHPCTVSVKGAAPYARFKKQIKWEDDIEY